MRGHSIVAVTAALVLIASAARAEDDANIALDWQPGPATFPIEGDLAEIELSEDFVFLDRPQTEKLMQLTGNPLTGSEAATIAGVDESSWFLVLEWDAIGYVPDEDKDSLDPEALLESIQAGTEASNAERRERGWSELNVVGWEEKPFYDERTHNLTWSIRAESDGETTLNRTIKLLGRRGVMTATLVASPEELTALTPQIDSLLDGYRFQPGSTYAEFVPGTDRMAEIGLAALVAGGAGALLAKSGLLARFWKLLVVGGLGLVAGVRKLFGRTTAQDSNA